MILTCKCYQCAGSDKAVMSSIDRTCQAVDMHRRWHHALMSRHSANPFPLKQAKITWMLKLSSAQKICFIFFFCLFIKIICDSFPWWLFALSAKSAPSEAVDPFLIEGGSVNIVYIIQRHAQLAGESFKVPSSEYGIFSSCLTCVEGAYINLQRYLHCQVIHNSQCFLFSIDLIKYV